LTETNITMKKFLSGLFIGLSFGSLMAQEGRSDAFAHTYSIVARDAKTGEMGVAVQSHWFAVGTLVSWGKSGVGVVATQSLVNPAFGPEGLALMEKGLSAVEVKERLIAQDEGRAYRQAAFLDAQGNVAAHTGSSCIAEASHAEGAGFSVQANMMLSDQVVPAMKKAFESFAELPLAERMLKAMEAAESVGGDIRGKQSAALLVVGPQKTDQPWTDKKIDLRVDDHTDPIGELSRLLTVHKAYDYMNAGDVAMEHGDMEKALELYDQAQALQPQNIEMVFWKAVTLLNNNREKEALPLLQKVLAENSNWGELLRRLPQAGLLNLTPEKVSKLLQTTDP